MKTDLSIKAAIYLRAAELVEQGHCKETLCQDAYGGVLFWQDIGSSIAVKFCYRGAIMRARFEITGDLPQMDGRGKWKGVGPLRLINWNNAPDTTAAMVAAKLREQAFA